MLSVRVRVRMAVLVSVLWMVPAGAVEVALDGSSTFQTVEGIGRCRLRIYSVKDGPFYSPVPMEHLVDTLVGVMGLSMSRGFRTSSCEFNPSPGNYRVTQSIREELSWNRAIRAASDSAGQIYRYSPNVFSPPGWMKYNGQCSGSDESNYDKDTTNSLMPAHYADFAALCSAYVRVCVDTFGLPVYAFSPQNEPRFNEPYASCSYKDGWHYARMLRQVGPSIKRADPTTMIYGCEHMGWAYPQWERQVLADAEAAPYLDRFAIHNYVDGVSVDTTTFDSLPDEHARPLWVSENAGKHSFDTPDSALILARTILKAFTRSGVSAFMAAESQHWWDPAGGRKYGSFWVYCHFARFIRPNMKRIGAQLATADPDLMVGAFANDDLGSLSLIVVNTATSERTIDLASASTLPAEFEARQTTATEWFVDLGTVSSDASIVVPPRSILSLGHLHRDGDGTATASVHEVSRLHPRADAHVVARSLTVVDLRGRTAGPALRGATGLAPGAYCRVARDGTGRTIVDRFVAHTRQR